ncbi:MAG: hypothetical protein IPH28_25715 [Cytophagaceae bacterium]|nr:hypothetical protein [Cytophagaceae bacterium]
MKNNRFKRVLFMGMIFLSGFAALSGVVMVCGTNSFWYFPAKSHRLFEAIGLWF